MTLEELQDLVDKDLKLNDSELDLESLKTPQIHNKYLKHYNNFKLLLVRAESEHKILKREKWEYYTGKASPQVYKDKPFDLKILKTDIDKYLDSDVDLQKLSQKISYLGTVVDYLDKVLRQITNRDWQIKNAIEWRKFTSGAV
jgi:antirestriction protein|tara:strand:- start:13679 stop:14107 length:429 start_codon:yes stop_codon:yes gene_type:complete